MCGPLLDSSQLSKKIGLRLQGKSGARRGILVCGVDGPPNCYFCWEGGGLQRLKVFKEKRNCVYGWCLGG